MLSRSVTRSPRGRARPWLYRRLAGHQRARRLGIVGQWSKVQMRAAGAGRRGDRRAVRVSVSGAFGSGWGGRELQAAVVARDGLCPLTRRRRGEGCGRVEGRPHGGRSHICVTPGGSRLGLAFEMAPGLPDGGGWAGISTAMPSRRRAGSWSRARRAIVMDACAGCLNPETIQGGVEETQRRSLDCFGIAWFRSVSHMFVSVIYNPLDGRPPRHDMQLKPALIKTMIKSRAQRLSIPVPTPEQPRHEARHPHRHRNPGNERCVPAAHASLKRNGPHAIRVRTSRGALALYQR